MDWREWDTRRTMRTRELVCTAGRYALVWMYFLVKPAGPGSAHADGVSGTEGCGGIRPARAGYQLRSIDLSVL